jgi:hypothetical protein
MAEEDRPIIVGGAAHHITVQLPNYSGGDQPQTFSLTPNDPAVPFKSIVITDGPKEIFRWPLSDEWKIIIE